MSLGPQQIFVEEILLIQRRIDHTEVGARSYVQKHRRKLLLGNDQTTNYKLKTKKCVFNSKLYILRTSRFFHFIVSILFCTLLF